MTEVQNLPQGTPDNVQINQLSQHVKRFLTNCRFLRQFIGKKVPKASVIAHARATGEVARFIGNDYIIDNNGSIDFAAILTDKDYRTNYLKNVVVHRTICEMELAPRGVQIHIYSDGTANIIYKNGDTIKSHYAAMCPVNVLSYVNTVVGIEISARKSVEDIEMVLDKNMATVDKAKGDIAIKNVMIARCIAQGIITEENELVTSTIEEQKLGLTPQEFLKIFSDTPFALADFITLTTEEFNERHGSKIVTEVPRAHVFDDTIAEQTGSGQIYDHDIQHDEPSM